MACGAEPAVTKKGFDPDAVMDPRPLARGDGRSVQYAVAKMAGGTKNTVSGQEIGSVSIHIRSERLEFGLEQWFLLISHWCVAIEAAGGIRFGIFYDLAEQARRESLGMSAMGPVSVLIRMAGAAFDGRRW